MSVQTPHINLKEGSSFAKTVLMPGDPLRAKMIAETFLEDAELINNVRGIHGYTGTYKGHRVSVMASGMGIPSIGIYSFELFSFFGVENIIRIGSAGGLKEDVKLRDVVAGIGADTNSAFSKQYGLNGTLAATCSYELLSTAIEEAKKLGIDLKVGNLYSSDTFYDADEDPLKKWAEAGYFGNRIITSETGTDCDDTLGSLGKWLKTIYDIMKYAVPVVIVVLGIKDFISGTISGNDDALKKAGSAFIKRLIWGAAFVALPVLITMILTFAFGGSFADICIF